MDKSIQKDAGKTKYREVRLGETLHEILTERTYVIPQYPVFSIIAKDFPGVKSYYDYISGLGSFSFESRYISVPLSLQINMYVIKPYTARRIIVEKIERKRKKEKNLDQPLCFL